MKLFFHLAYTVACLFMVGLCLIVLKALGFFTL